MAETIDYAAILADLEAKKAALEQAIAAVRSAIAMGAAGQAGDIAASSAAGGSVSTIHNGEVPAGAFLGKSIPEATKLYLEIVKRKQSSKEIADALKKGGMESTSSNFHAIVHAVLARACKSGFGIVKLDKPTWGLAAWYPRGISTTAAPQKKNKSKGKKKAKKTASTATLESKTTVESKKATPSPTVLGFNERAMGVLRQQPSKDFSIDEIAKRLGAKPFTVKMQLEKLAKKNAVEKTTAGYRAVLRQTPVNAAVV